MNRSLPPLKSIVVFGEVAKHLNYSKASKQLHVTISAVSQQIKLLEENLQVSLFKRNASGVTLTHAGERYAEQVNLALGILQEATRQIRPPSASPSKTLTVHLMNSLAANWLIPKLSEFYTLAPTIDLRISTHWENVDFNHENMNILIGYGTENQWPTLYCEPLMTDHLVAIAHPTLIHTLPPSLEERLRHATWIETEGTLRESDWFTWLQAVKLTHLIPHKKITVPSTLHGLQAARNGLGIFVTHKIFVAHDLAQHTLSQASPIGTKTNAAYYWVCSHAALENPSVQIFKRWITPS